MIDENTICKPISMYERIKLEIENHLLAASKNIFEVVILRPTAVFGANGKNLVKLADALLTSRRSVNYLKSCLFNYRTMNLVYIDNVISAIMFLIGEDHEAVNGQVFIISDDEDPSNNYRDIEISLMDYFKQKKYIFPVIPVPLYILSLFLRCIGRTSYNPSVVYSCRKILDTGFKKPVLFKDALREFAEWYINDFSPNKSQHN
jgi:nucleoside-diphosphate-sugar epimerase